MHCSPQKADMTGAALPSAAPRHPSTTRTSFPITVMHEHGDTGISWCWGLGPNNERWLLLEKKPTSYCGGWSLWKT